MTLTSYGGAHGQQACDSGCLLTVTECDVRVYAQQFVELDVALDQISILSFLDRSSLELEHQHGHSQQRSPAQSCRALLRFCCLP